MQFASGATAQRDPVTGIQRCSGNQLQQAVVGLNLYPEHLAVGPSSGDLFDHRGKVTPTCR
ncbi:hypothetical protein GCM10009104_14260 [Marinobacterium maritimum]|uniref:Uncharacterized protein n=1 Tax=Marinobacterium maritimum TaxID=500162 RepID=A0ABP3TAU0_9GAMM